MSMPLVDEIPLSEVTGEFERFEYLEGVRELVTKAMEFHADDGNDAEYCYLFWVSDEDAFITRIKSNLEQTSGSQIRYWDHGWELTVDHNGTGLVFVRAFL